ncbi:MAG: HD domain-containing protein [Candidatus Dojkabacteria bacterium]|nr:MAG: HD domain-containing protein [Candidatus Dojkabacteria bacterium]
MDKKLLIDVIMEKVPTQYHSLLIEALQFAEEVHKDQIRKSGEPFLFHPLNVAAIVAEINLDTDSIIAALLHNCFKEKSAQEIRELSREIEEKFGEEVLKMVKNIDRFSAGTRSETDAAVITKYIMACTDDIRLVLIKLADRLHNSRTIDALTAEQQQKAAKNIINIYSPLCTYLNLYDFKKELEETAFKIMDPKKFELIDKRLTKLKINDHAEILKIKKRLADLLSPYGMHPIIYGRIKGHYSIHTKLKDKGVSKNFRLEDIKDLMAFTILVDKVEECYKVAEIVVKNSDIDMSEYDDYIRHPKKNGYRAIHIQTSFADMGVRAFEVQIKTEEMHQYNMYGPASHIVYKIERELGKGNPREYYWVKELHKSLYEYQQIKKSRSIPIRSDIFKNKVFVFTPQNRLIELPVGSTVVDFAYEIHSDLGNKMTGCRLNGRKSKVWTMLATGDLVEVITDESQELPDREWLKFVRTRKAREAIESAISRNSEGVKFTHTIQ